MSYLGSDKRSRTLKADPYAPRVYKPQPYTRQQTYVLANVRRLRPVAKVFNKVRIVCYLLDRKDVSSTVRTLKRRGAIAWSGDETIPRLTPDGASRLTKLMSADSASFERSDGSKVRGVKTSYAKGGRRGTDRWETT